MSTVSSTTRTGLKHRVVDIEQALHWAYQSELPKRREDRAITAPLPPRTHPMWRFGAFGGRIDNWSRDPGFPPAMGDPHADALRIEAAVDALDEEALDIAPYAIGEGLGDHVDLRHVTAITRRDVRAWLVTYARNGKRPEPDESRDFEPVRGANGRAVIWQTVERSEGTSPDGAAYVSRFDQAVAVKSGGHYPPGAFCKLHWTRSGDDVAEERVRWALWHAGLADLAAVLAPVLQDLSVTGTHLPMRPWIEAMPPTRPVLASRIRRCPPLEARRAVALHPPARRHDPGRRVPQSEWAEVLPEAGKRA